MKKWIVLGLMLIPAYARADGYLGPDATAARPFYTSPAASSGGAGSGSGYSYISTASTNAQNIAASASTLYSVVACNQAASLRYVRLYNLNRAPAPASDVPAWRGSLPSNGGCVTLFSSTIGAGFSTGISFDITIGSPDNDTGATSANDVSLNVVYH